jgi:hypothetical protein
MQTFESKYSSWYQPLNQKQKEKYKAIEKLVLSINKNLKDEVISSYKKNNYKIRKALSEKIGFSLHYKSVEQGVFFESNERVTIPIKVEDSVPTKLLEILEDSDDDLLELLLNYNSMVTALKELKFQLEKYDSFSKFHEHNCSRKEIQSSIFHLRKLIDAVDSSGIIEKLKKLGPDILGAYYFYDRRVELYWLSIGMYSLIYNTAIDELTIVVLAHELAHGYSHVGFDIDGNDWDTTAFSKTDLKIVEGIAQFYTEMICNDFSERASKTFNNLLEKQEIQYCDYKNWFETNEENKYEKMRSTIRKVRKHRITEYEHFNEVLDRIRRDS